MSLNAISPNCIALLAKEKTPLSKGAVANLQSLDNRIGNVRFAKRFNDLLYSPIIVLGKLMCICKESKNIFLQILQTTVIKNRHFANKGLQRNNVYCWCDFIRRSNDECVMLCKEAAYDLYQRLESALQSF